MHSGRRLLALGTLLVTSAVANPAQAVEDAWRREIVPRFGAAADVPAKRFIALPDPENADGQTWLSVDDGGMITLYGGFIVVAPDFAGYRSWREESERADGTRITYRAGGTAWFVISGLKDARIVYERVEIACKGEGFVAIRFDYPAGAAKRWKTLVEHGARSLEALAAEACD